MAAQTARQIKVAREQVAMQFEQERIRFGMTVERRLPNFRYILRDQVEHKEYRALVLPCSFDFYEYRLNIGKHHIDMLIVARHNAAVPIEVLSLETVTKFAPLDAPEPEQLRSERKRNSHEDANLLLSKLILEFESAKEALAKMTPRTRCRYEQRRKEYLKPRVGRPWAS